MNNKIINIFLVSSSLPIFLITMTYVGLALRKNKPNNSAIPYEFFPIFIPLLFGLFGVLNHYIINNYGINYSLITGLLFGLLLSSIGRFYLNLPVQLFKFTKNNEYQVHIFAGIMYALIFRFIVTPLTIN